MNIRQNIWCEKQDYLKSLIIKFNLNYIDYNAT